MSTADVIYGMLVYGSCTASMVVLDLMLFYLHFDLVYKALTLPLYICPTPACLVLIITDARHCS